MGFLDNFVKSIPSISLKSQAYCDRHIALRKARLMGPAGWLMLWGANPSFFRQNSLQGLRNSLPGSNSDNLIASVFNGSSFGSYGSGSYGPGSYGPASYGQYGSFGSYNPYSGGSPYDILTYGDYINGRIQKDLNPDDIVLDPTDPKKKTNT